MGAPLLGDLASIIALKNYNITKDDFDRMYDEDKQEINNKNA
ncbi:hypothetical protein [Clostridium perfringens]|nr:hypothetical protein [Clostridium perfringens]